MASLLVRNLDAELVRKLKLRAARHGRSAEAEHREILRAAFADGREFEALAARFRRRLAGRRHTPSETLLRESRRERQSQLGR